MIIVILIPSPFCVLCLVPASLPLFYYHKRAKMAANPVISVTALDDPSPPLLSSSLSSLSP